MRGSALVVVWGTRVSLAFLGGVFSFAFYTDMLTQGVSSDLGDVPTGLVIISDFIQALKVSSSVCTDISGIWSWLPRCLSYKDSNDIVLLSLLLQGCTLSQPDFCISNSCHLPALPNA